jgi:hypothetical protein
MTRLERDRDQKDGRESCQRHQATCDEPRAIALNEFRLHVSPPSWCQEKPWRSERGSFLLGFSTANRRPRRSFVWEDWTRRGLALRSEDPRAGRLFTQQAGRLRRSRAAHPNDKRPGTQIPSTGKAGAGPNRRGGALTLSWLQQKRIGRRARSLARVRHQALRVGHWIAVPIAVVATCLDECERGNND